MPLPPEAALLYVGLSSWVDDQAVSCGCGSSPTGRAAGGAMPSHRQDRAETIVLQTIAIILIILWLLGLVSSYTMGGFIHILLVVAIVVILVRVIQGRKAV